MTDSAGGEPPKGRRFSHVYLSSEKLLPDSDRMRHRLAHLFLRMADTDGKRYDLDRIVNAELGVGLPGSSRYPSSWEQFFRDAKLRDVLDTVTIIYKRLFDGPSERREWLAGS